VPQAQPAVPAQTVQQAQTQAAAVAPAPAYAPPPPVVVAQAAPMPPATYAAPAQQVPAAAPSYLADPPRVQPVPDYRPAAPAIQPVPSGQFGSIASIEPIRKRPQGTGTGAVVGGVLGAVVGNQFGHGLGRAAMTGVGAAGGAIAGNNVERNYKTAVVGYRVTVRLDNGHTRTFQRSSIGNLHVGERVRVDANGLHHA
jgi:outer membrane lipoprotein SlyB